MVVCIIPLTGLMLRKKLRSSLGMSTCTRPWVSGLYAPESSSGLRKRAMGLAAVAAMALGLVAVSDVGCGVVFNGSIIILF